MSPCAIAKLLISKSYDALLHKLYENAIHLRYSRAIARRFQYSTPLCTARLFVASEENHDGLSRAAEQGLSSLKHRVEKLLQQKTPIQEDSALLELRNCEAYARSIAKAICSSEIAAEDDNSPASTLLSLEKQHEKLTFRSLKTDLVQSLSDQIANEVSEIAYSIIVDSKVFITTKLLAAYVRTQCLLGTPETLSQAFVLYASKPIHSSNTFPLRLKPSNPDRVASAIPLTIVNEALSAAIEAKDLLLCLDIINTGVCTTAFRRSKLIHRALLPLFGFALTPVGAYNLASQISVHQNSMDSAMATNTLFAGIMAYVGFTATIGFVVVTTSNDHMDRITWVTGTPLRERWRREEERALIDRVAGSWGFKETSRKGEEEGKDWETLREWVGLRGMMLDRVELMEGME